MNYLQMSVVPSHFRSRLITLLAFFAPLTIIQIKGYTIFFFLLIISSLLLLFSRNSAFLIDKVFFLILILLLFTTIMAYIDSIGPTWQKRALKGFLTLALIGFVYFLIGGSERTQDYVVHFRKGIMLAINLNLIWSILQVALYQLFHIDLNTLLFVDKLHMVETGSMYRGDLLVATGLHWHPGNLAPLLVIGFLLNRRLWYRLIIIVVALFSYSSTCILGVAVCIGLEFVFTFINSTKNKTQNKRSSVARLVSFILEVTLALILVILVIKLNLFERFSVVLNNFMTKISLSGTDTSSGVHLRYYQLLPQILGNISLPKAIFGFGYGCSGYLYTLMVGQYANLESWSVESDFVNNVLGMGILNTIIFYLWYLSIAIRGIKIDYKYFILITAIFIQGFAYNVQFDWVILTICILILSIKQHWNFFDAKKNDF